MTKFYFWLSMALMACSVLAQATDNEHSGHDQHALHEQSLTISEVQLYNLGVKIGSLRVNQEVPLLSAPGKVVIPPSNEYIVSAAQAGLINMLTVSVGDRVSKGQVLAEINSPELLVLESQFLKALSYRQLGWASYQRDHKLFKQGVIAKRRWLQTQSQYQVNEAEVDAAKQLLELSGFSKQDIKRLRDTRKLTRTLKVYSPIEGVVLERMITAGKRVEMLAPLYRVANLEQLWLEINIPHERVINVNLGDKILIDNSTASARISLLAQNVDTDSQTLLARAVINATDTLGIHAGQTVNTRVLQTSERPVFSVPNAAIAKREGQAYIFIRNDTGFIVEAVEILGKKNNQTIIASDLHGDEQIALRGAVALKAKWLGLGDAESKGGHDH